MKHNFKELKIWQVGMDISDMIFEFIATLPNNERYNLIDQLNRASVSIPSNIAEGCGKRTNIHFAEFLSTSLSSCYEVETQLLITERRNIGNKDLRNKILLIIDEEQKMIFKFREKLLNN
ncbi:MAG: four helix bundle protein [Bacteroidia bacterium]